MKRIKIILLSLASSLSATAADLDVIPGQLSSLIANGSAEQSELKLKGRIDARDLAALENLSSEVKTLDLSEVKIESLSMPEKKYFGRTLFSEGEIPAYTFFKSGLNTLILPENVSTIRDGAFAGSSITEIIIPEGITSLGNYVFYGCAGLKKINLPKSLTHIGKGTFGNCMALESIDLGDTGITEIPERAFAGSMALSEVKLPPTVTKIGREAFSHTAIKSLALNNVMHFDDYALSSMPWLETLAINPDADIQDGLLMDDISLTSLTGVPDMMPDYFAANCRKLDASATGGAELLGRYAFANTLAPEVLIFTGRLSKIERGALSGLNSIAKIDVTDLDGHVPATAESAFEGLNQQDIILMVTDTAFNLWAGDEAWGRFKVTRTTNTGMDELPTAEGDITIASRNGSVVIESPAIINDVRIYTTDGRTAYVGTPNRTKVEIDTSILPSGIVIAIASDENGNSKTVSILLQ